MTEEGGPRSEGPTLAGAQKEIAYYRDQVGGLTAQVLKQDYAMSVLRHQLKQNQQGFSLLAELSQGVGTLQDASAIFDLTAQRINALLDMTKTAVFLPDPDGVTYRMAHWIGFEPERAAALSTLRLSLAPDAFGSNGVQLVNGSTERTPEVEAISKALELPFFVCMPVFVDDMPIASVISGRIRETMPRSPPLDDADLATFASIAAFVSGQIRRMRLAALEELDRLKTDFFANISHEFRTPIALTLGPITAVLEGRHGTVSETVAAQLKTATQSQQRLLSLINRILALAKLEAKSTSLRAERVPDFNAFVRERVTMFHSMADAKRVDLRLSLDRRLDGVDVFLDRERMDEVIFNLISNAIKFTDKGHVEVATEYREAHMLLRVTDTGVGISPDRLPIIFERFRQAHETDAGAQVGTGIGLALVAEIVKLHGGQVTADSRRGFGSTFQVVLPVGRAHLPADWVAEQQVVASTSRRPPPPPSKPDLVTVDGTVQALDVMEAINTSAETTRDPNKPTILYADDNSDLVRYVRDLLAPEYNVFVASNGQEGLERARKLRPDLILSDLMMPVMGGNEFCKAVRADRELKTIPFILLTAKSGDEGMLEGLDEGANDYLTKPFREPEVLARVRNLVALRRGQLLLERELQAARAIQQSLLPASPHAVAGGRLESLYRPCDALSGDFFDAVTSGSVTCFYLVDVTSHGTAAAQVTYLLRGLFREALATLGARGPLDELVRSVATRYASYGTGFSAALQLCRFDASTSTLECTRGQAPAPILVRGGQGEMLKVRPGMGISSTTPQGKVYVETLSVLPGDAVYLFTDGAYEFVTAGRPYGLKRFAALVGGLPEAGWSDAAFEALAAANGSDHFVDDLTIVKFVVEGNAATG